MSSFKLLNTRWEHPLLSTGIQLLRARPIRVFILAVVAALSLLWLRDIARLSSIHEQYQPVHREQFYRWNTKPVVTPYSEANADTPCKRFPTNVFETVQIVLKTGMTEDPQRLLTHLNSVTKCIPNLLTVSDHDDLVNDHKIFDVLAELSASYQESNPDFATYYTQKALKALKESDNITQYNTEAGWKLDRFKFLPMVHMAYSMSPKAQWFVFIETDTYIFWDNLFRLLQHFNSFIPLYMGSPLHGDNHGEDYIYAYGGSGIVLSRAAIHALLERNTDKNGAYIEDELYEQEYWVDMLKNSTYGESILGYALQKKANVKLSGFYPMFHPMNPESLKFSEENLCTPIISLHSLRSEKAYEALWNWEMGPGDGKPIVFSNLLEFLYPHENPIRNDWDNLSPDLSTNESAHINFESCREACTANATCLQYLYHSPRCYTSTTISLGNPCPPEVNGSDEIPYVSGWIVERVEDLLRNGTCEEVKWLKPSDTRHWIG